MEQVGGGLDTIEAAISALDQGASAQDGEEIVDSADGQDEVPRARPKAGQIGEGKGVPLKQNQRKRALWALILISTLLSN